MKNTIKNTQLLILLIIVNLSINPLLAESFDGTSDFTCSMHSVLECTSDYQCKQVTPESVNLVNFFEISLADKEIRAAGISRSGAKTSIERVESFAGKLLIQGGDLNDENESGAIGWSIIIGEVDGEFSMSAISNSFVFVGFGACLAP